MIVRIVKCPKCLKKTLLVTATNSSVSKKCSSCNFNETTLLKDFKKEVKE